MDLVRLIRDVRETERFIQKFSKRNHLDERTIKNYLLKSEEFQANCDIVEDWLVSFNVDVANEFLIEYTVEGVLLRRMQRVLKDLKQVLNHFKHGRFD